MLQNVDCFIPDTKPAMILQVVPCRLCEAGAVRGVSMELKLLLCHKTAHCLPTLEMHPAAELQGWIEDNPWIRCMKMWVCVPGVL